MAKKSFDLGSKLADVLNVSVPDTGAEQIVRLPLEQIDADERNFYSVEGLEALAANIELVGLLDPIRVREDPDAPGRYRIVSGHRRSAALRLLAEEDPEKWSAAPCIIEAPAASPELQELRLIYANADTRRMTSAEISAQAERVEQLLYQLKEQGMDFPGRMRDHVAEACKVSTTKLAELKVIREKLIPQLREAWEAATISHACAYKLAQQSEEIQKVAYLDCDLKYLTESRVDGVACTCKKLIDRKCDKRPIGKCTYAKTLIHIELGPGYYSCSNYPCCKSCPNLVTCKDSCPNVVLIKEKLKQEKKQIRAEQRAVEKKREDAAIDVTRKIWTRFGELRRAKDLSAEDCCKARGDQWIASYHGEDWHAEMEGPNAKITEHTAVPWTNSMQADDVQKLVKTADLFGVSTDYLLGRTDAKDVYKGEWISVDDRYPEEGTFCLAFTKFGAVIPSVYWRASFMDFSERSTANKRLERVERWMRLPPPPDGRKYTGQETLEGMMKK